MTRALVLGVLACAFVAWLVSGAREEPTGLRYTVQLDTGTGLVPGGDFKVAGVRAGVIEDVRLERPTRRALVDVLIEEPGAGDFRRDVRCTVRPQSLLGEYFLDCDPGTGPALPPGSTVPVERTTATIPPDLVTNVLRRPYADRLRLIVSSLGAGVAGNGERLDAALRRAVPAITETDRVLALLARQERALDTLTHDADTVLRTLARRKADVGRFVDQTGRAAVATAERHDDLQTALRASPGFLREVTPTMRALGDLARRGTPALRDVRAASPALERTLVALPPVADGAGPLFERLGRAAVTGRRLVTPVRGQLRLLRSGSRRLPEVFTNLRAVVEHLDDRDNAVEDDPRSPGGRGFTGFEGLLRYFVYQGTTLNSFDGASHILNAALFESRCAFYREPADLRADPSLAQECAGTLGPNQPGITTPDPSDDRGAPARRTAEPEGERPPASLVPDRPGGPATTGPTGPAATATPAPAADGDVPLLDLGALLPGLLPPALAPGQPGADRDQLLDYLLGP